MRRVSYEDVYIASCKFDQSGEEWFKMNRCVQNYGVSTMKSGLIKHPLTFLVLSLICVGCTNQTNISHAQLRENNNQNDLFALNSQSALPDRPLTFDDILSVALCQNLSLKVKEQEYAIQREVVTRERLNMLPKITANLEDWGRNRNTGSSSQSLVPGQAPAPTSISSDQDTLRSNVNAVFNLLDFGLAFFRSRQEANKALISQLEYEKLRQNLVVDVTRQYWSAIVAKFALDKSKEVIEKILQQQATLQKQMQNRVISDIQGLRNENQLINTHAQLQQYEKEYLNAKAQLALLMGITPGVDFDLADIEETGVDVDVGNVDDLEQYAMINRPELYSADAEELIRTDEARAAIIQMFPGVELFGGPFYDHNSFLVFNHWWQAGLRATWDLLNIPRYMKEREIACSRKELSRRNRLALAIGVMSQVHLAYNIYHANLESYMLMKELESVNKRLLLAAKSEKRQGKRHDADILQYESESLFSQISTFKAYAELANALEQLNNSVGIPLHFKNNIGHNVSNFEDFGVCRRPVFHECARVEPAMAIKEPAEEYSAGIKVEKNDSSVQKAVPLKDKALPIEPPAVEEVRELTPAEKARQLNYHENVTIPDDAQTYSMPSNILYYEDDNSHVMVPKQEEQIDQPEQRSTLKSRPQKPLSKEGKNIKGQINRENQ